MPTRKYICDTKIEDKCDYSGTGCPRSKPHSHRRHTCGHNNCDYSSKKNGRIRCIVFSTDIDILFDKLLYDFGEKKPRTKKPRNKKQRTDEGMWDTGINTWTT